MKFLFFALFLAVCAFCVEIGDAAENSDVNGGSHEYRRRYEGTYNQYRRRYNGRYNGTGYDRRRRRYGEYHTQYAAGQHNYNGEGHESDTMINTLEDTTDMQPDNGNSPTKSGSEGGSHEYRRRYEGAYSQSRRRYYRRYNTTGYDRRRRRYGEYHTQYAAGQHNYNGEGHESDAMIKTLEDVTDMQPDNGNTATKSGSEGGSHQYRRRYEGAYTQSRRRYYRRYNTTGYDRRRRRYGEYHTEYAGQHNYNREGHESDTMMKTLEDVADMQPDTGNAAAKSGGGTGSYQYRRRYEGAYSQSRRRYHGRYNSTGYAGYGQSRRRYGEYHGEYEGGEHHYDREGQKGDVMMKTLEDIADMQPDELQQFANDLVENKASQENLDEED